MRPVSVLRMLGVLTVAGLMSLAPSARADVISFSPNGTGAAGPVFQVGSFDWSPGSALAQAVIPNGGPVTVGTQFDLLFHASLANFLDASGNVIPNAIPAGQEFTVVARFREVVTGVAILGGNPIATFALAANQSNSFLQIYAGAKDSDPLTGNGYENGRLILNAGTFTSSNSSFNQTGTSSSISSGPPVPPLYAGKGSVTGNGSTNLAADTITTDPTYFLSAPKILALATQTTQSLPFNSVSPSAGFYLTTGTNTVGGISGKVLTDYTANIGAMNGVNGPDFLFQADAATNFVVPEPSSMVLVAMGTVGLSALGLKRRRTGEVSA